MIRLLSKNLPIIVVLVGLTGCGGGVLGIGDETSLYRVGNNADTAPAVAQGRLPLYIARPQMPSGADADRIPTVEMQEITYLAEARWASPAPEMISDLLKESIERNVNQAYVPIQSGLPDHHLLSTRFTSYAAYYENGSEKPPVPCGRSSRTRSRCELWPPGSWEIFPTSAGSREHGFVSHRRFQHCKCANC